jgi:hypothetical protein
LPVDGIVLVTRDKWQSQQYLGGAVAMRARRCPPPDRILHGTHDYGRRARVDDVLASGYVIAQIAMMPNDHAGTTKHDMTMLLARSYAPLSDFL